MIAKKNNLFFWLIGFFLFSPILSAQVLAVSIAPTRQTIVIDPGQSTTVFLQIKNDESQPKTFVPEVEAFSLAENTGAISFGQTDEAVAWVKPNQDKIEILPSGQGSFSFTISVPDNIEPRSHYLVLFAREVIDVGQVALGARGGSLLFLHVAGPVFEDLTKRDFSSAQKIYITANPKLTLSLVNNGTIHLVPKGEITLWDSAGNGFATININENNRKVLPGESWTENFEIPTEVLGGRFGKVTASGQVTFGQTQKQIFFAETFWIIPTWLLILGTSSLLILFFIFFGLTKIFKRKR